MARLLMARRRRKHRWSWQRQAALWNSAVTLAGWRWRTQWFLLLITGIGITVAVVLIGSLPLFSDVMNTAGLRSVLRAQSDSAQFVADISVAGLSTDMISSDAAQVNNLVTQDAGHYIQGKPQLSVISGDWGASTLSGDMPLDFYGVPLQTAQAHLRILQGHLPTTNSSNSSSIDIMLTRTAAQNLGVKVGATISLTTTLLTAPVSIYADPNSARDYDASITVHVVGLFQTNANDAYWNGYTLEAIPPVAGEPPPAILALVDQTSLLNMFDAIAKQNGAQGIFFADKNQNILALSYLLNTSAITNNELNDVIVHLGKLQEDTTQTFNPDTFDPSNNLAISTVTLSGPILHSLETSSTLEKFQSQVEIMQTPTLLLTLQIVCLILFFISTMIGALVERDQASMAVLRSRGANRRQVFGSLLTQGFFLCLFAACIGPILAAGLVYLVAPRFLTATTQDALNTLTLDPWQAIHALSIYTLAAIAVTFLTLLVSFYLAVRANILTQRRDEARSTRLPLWQRLRLDLFGAALAIVGYIIIFYLESTQQLLSAQSQSLISTPLQLLAPLLLLLAGILFFLRLFPLLLRLLARIAQRRRGISSMLALAQMGRAPNQAMRMALLLGLATAFAFFSLIFSASQGQRAQDLATYQTVSDFSGYNFSLPETTPTNTNTQINQVATPYRQIQGVTSVTLGSVNALFLNLNGTGNQAYERSTVLTAVDAATFAQTALWTPQDSSQSLTSLMAMLISQRPLVQQRGEVPAIIAASTWQLLGLTPGQTFHLDNSDGDPDPTTYLAVAEVNHIPPVDDNIQGALLVDYQSLVAGAAYYQETTQLNYVWLRSSDNPAAVNYVRTALNRPNLALAQFMDRRALSSSNAINPLAQSLLTILTVGVAAALLLAFLANLLLPLLSVRMRQTNFAVLRALGTEPGQVTSILLWEQAIILATAMLLGLAFGGLLAFTAVPPLVFTGALPTNLVNISSQAIYTLQKIIPVVIVIPPSLLAALAVLLLLCLFALGLMTRLAQRPLLGQALRLNED